MIEEKKQQQEREREREKDLDDSSCDIVFLFLISSPSLIPPLLQFSFSLIHCE
jgi:hypothetical protein